MADPMRIRAQLMGDKVDVRVLMSHEMETGQRKDAEGKTIPAHFIQSVSATCNGKTVLSAQWGPAVSKNPTLAFRFSGAKAGDKVIVTWVDNKGDKRTDEATITAGS
jgi:sulfur-oxidizing protein SoxZ